MSKPYAIYVRQSEDQHGAGLAVARQVEDCLALARRLRLRSDPVIYSDNDISASGTKRRPGYQRLLEALRAGEHEVLLIWHNDRLHRRPSELEEFIALVEAIELRIAVVRSGDLDLATPSGRAVARILGAIARQEVEHKGDRRRRSEFQRAELGVRRKSGLRSFGYGGSQLVDGAVHWIGKDQINVREAAAIRDAAQRLMNGERPYDIWSAWNAAGLMTVTGRPWTTSTFRVMMCRKSLAGLVTYRGELLKGVAAQWPAILTQRQHYEVERILSTQIRHRKIWPVHNALFAGIPECGVCGRPAATRMHPTRRQRADGQWVVREVERYECYARTSGYHAQAIAATADELILTSTAAVLYDQRHQPRAAHTIINENAALHRQMARIQARKTNLVHAVADATLTNEMVRYHLAELEDEARSVGLQLTQLSAKDTRADDAYRQADAFLDSLAGMRVDAWPRWFEAQHPDLGPNLIRERILIALRALPPDVRRVVVRSSVQVTLHRATDTRGQLEVTPRQDPPSDT